MKCFSYDHFFRVCANKSRLSIIEALQKGPKSVSQITSELKEEQSKVSHNLKLLLDCNFVVFKQQGKSRIYSLNSETIVPLMKLVQKHVTSMCKGKCCLK